MEDAGEKFELIKHLGTGGFAQTHKARVLDPELVEEFGTEIVALKIPLSRKKANTLRKEIEANITVWLHLKALKAGNVCRYLGFDIFRNDFVMVMEYVQGSLRDRIGAIGRQQALPPEEAVEITKGLLRGLIAIHEAHIFHRDIKPENVLMDGNVPKIADFGISRMLESNELASTTTGTIFYMSPEILGASGASFVSDIWSVGITLYELLTGMLPFGKQDTPIGPMVDLIRTQEPKPPHEVKNSITKALSTVVLRALEKDPARRFTTASEMLTALEGLALARDEALEKELAGARELLQSDTQRDTVEKKLRELVRSRPEEGRVYQYLGEFYNGCGRHNDAIQIFKKGIRQDPQNAVLCWDLALAYQAVGKRDAAAQSLEGALSLGLDRSVERHALRLLKVLKAGVDTP